MTLRKNTHLQSRGSKNAVKDLIVSNYICHALAISQKVYLFHICVYDKKTCFQKDAEFKLYDCSPEDCNISKGKCIYQILISVHKYFGLIKNANLNEMLEFMSSMKCIIYDL